MSYLGRGSNLTRKAQDKVSFLATAGQTVRTGLSYVPTHVDVTVNGITLTEITDYTATNGNSITFTVALALNDEVTIVSSKTFDVANHYTISAANTLLAAKLPLAGGTMTGALDVNAAATLGGGTDEIQIIGGGGTARVDAIGGNTNVNLSLSTKGSGKVYFWRGGYGGTQMALLDSDGLKFGADTAAANALDDYEEGTWTPTIVNGGSIGTVTYAIYTKVGDFVSFYLYCDNISITNNSSSFEIGGLPHQISQSPNMYGGGQVGYTHAYNWGQHGATLLVNPGGNKIYFHKDGGTAAPLTQANVQGLSYILLSGTYKSS